MKIVGHLVCQDGIPDILRAIESLFYICDEILVLDGGSTDGTWEFLKERKDVYGMYLYSNKFNSLRGQRRNLLNETETGNWVVCLDQDEKFSHQAQVNLRRYLMHVDPELYDKEASDRETPLVLPINHINLVQDPIHFDKKPIYHQTKVFYYDEGLKWLGDSYHCHLGYKEEDDKIVTTLPAVREFAVLHYARLDPERKQDEQRKKIGGYSEDAWEEGVEVEELPVELL